MTTGSWTVGNPSGGFWATKAWTGTDGKYESWVGGIRAKWNDYAVSHGIRTQSGTVVIGYGLPVISGLDLPTARGITGWSANDDLRLLNKLAEAIRGHSFDLGVNIAEATKSYGTITKNLRSIGTALLNLKHGNVAGALRALGSGSQRTKPLVAKDLTGRWLETQYAFMPLISQSYEAGKALKAVTGPRVLRFAVGSSAKRETTEGSDSLPNYSWPLHWSYSKRLVAELSEDIPLERSLGLVNPAEVAWELVPYSFVVDWFVPVGSYISALGQIPNLRGRFLTIERGAVKGGPVVDFTAGQYYAAANNKSSGFGYRRIASTSLSVPRPTFNSLPRALSPRHLLNAVALIHQRLR